MNGKHSKILLLIFLALILLSVSATYYRTMVLRDFEIIDDVDWEELEAEEEDM